MASVGALFAESGTCGGNLTWKLTTADSTLTIDGHLYILRDGKTFTVKGIARLFIRMVPSEGSKIHPTKVR